MQKINYKMVVGLLGIFLVSSVGYGAGPGDFWKRNDNYRASQGRGSKKDVESRTRKRGAFTSRHCKGSKQVETCYSLETCDPSEPCCSTETCEWGWSCIEPKSGKATCADSAWITTTCTSPYYVTTTVKGAQLNTSWVATCPVTTFCVDGQCTNEAPPCTDHDDTKFVSIAPEEGSLGAGSQQLANGDKSDEDPNTVTFAGFDLPDKCKGNHLEEMICMKKYGQIIPASVGVDCSLLDKVCLTDEKGNGFCGEEDQCPDVSGKQPTFLYDSDGDGKVDSCVPSEKDDKCPESPVIDLEYPYDADGDGKMDSCVPSEKDDKCPYPDVPGIQLDYPFDLNGDGKKDSCDLCPDLAGNQQAFPFDTDVDGVKDSCSPVKGDFCTNPTKPDGCTLYQYNDLLHLGCCLEDQPKTLLHIICAKDGKWAKSTTTCEGGDAFVCKEGACLDQVCQETDFGVDWENYGTVTADHLNTKEYWQPHEEAQDHCGESSFPSTYFSGEIKDVKTAADFSKSSQFETSCDLADTDKNGSLIKQEKQACAAGTFCVDMDQDGKKIFGCQPLKCEDPDGQNFDSYGTMTLKVMADGAEYPLATYYDTCMGSFSENLKTLKQTKTEIGFGEKGDYRKEYFCNADGYVDVTAEACPLGTYCMEQEKGGQKVLSCEPVTCEDTDQGIDWVTFGKVSWVGLSGGGPYHVDDKCSDSKTKLEMSCEPYGVGMTKKSNSEKCPEGQICVQPQPTDPPQCVPGEIKPPPPPKCVDGDKGINWDEVSTAWYGSLVYVDSCTNDHTKIQEIYCDADGKLAIAYQDCGPDAVCVKTYGYYDNDGKYQATKIECQKMSCFDSDGGLNEEVGTATYLGPYTIDVFGQWQDTGDKQTDYCSTDVGGFLSTKVEYYCQDGKIQSLETSCPEGKKCGFVPIGEGKTKIVCKGTCDETDKDNSPYAFGTVYTETNVPYPDYCSGNTVYQFRCNDLDELDEVPFYDCAQDGAICLDGACIQK